MKYLKTYETWGMFDASSGLEEQIQDCVNDFTYSDVFDGELDECPFLDQAAILHQRDYVDDFYVNMKELGNYNINKFSQIEFIKTFNRMIEDAEEEILDYIKRDPSLYYRWRPNLKNVPKWLKKAEKYNL